MGTSRSIYLGPYLEIPKISTQVEYNARGCSNPHCFASQKTFPSSQSFCSECGTPCALVTRSRTAIIRVRDVLGEDDETFYEVERLKSFVLLPNSYGVGLSCDEGENAVYEVLGGAREFQLKLFEEKYSKAIELLKQKFSEDAVHLKYGVVSSYG